MWSWLRRKPEPDYETQLSLLAESIAQREGQLEAIQLRERRKKALFITYGVSSWFLYLAACWLGLVRSTSTPSSTFEDLVVATPLVLGPIAIIFTRRIVSYYYKRQRDREVKTLSALKKEQREKVEELKRKTGYNSTRELLEKYDDAIKKNSETRKQGPSTSAANKPNEPRLNTAPPHLIAFPSSRIVHPGSSGYTSPHRAGTQSLSLPPLAPFSPAGSPVLQQGPIAPTVQTPMKRTLIDKLADALLGLSGDEGTPNSKYALICAQCFTHNGLVAKEEINTIQYRCPRCGHFNPARAGSTPSMTSSPFLDERERSSSFHRRRVQSVAGVMMRSSPTKDDRREELESSEPIEVDAFESRTRTGLGSDDSDDEHNDEDEEETHMMDETE